MPNNNCPVCGRAGEVPGNPYEGLLRCPGREHPMWSYEDEPVYSADGTTVRIMVKDVQPGMMLDYHSVIAMLRTNEEGHISFVYGPVTGHPDDLKMFGDGVLREFGYPVTESYPMEPEAFVFVRMAKSYGA